MTVAGEGDADGAAKYVSRGGHKLAGALKAFAGLSVAGKRWPGRGRVDRRVHRRAVAGGRRPRGGGGRGLRPARVVAAERRAGDLVDRVNVRALEGQVAPPPEVVVADLSFISLTLVLPALVTCAAPGADLALMVKPQFEVGRGRVGPGGVVRSQEDRAGAVRTVAASAASLGLGVLGVTASPLPARRATWSTSCGSGRERPRWTRPRCLTRSSPAPSKPAPTAG